MFILGTLGYNTLSSRRNVYLIKHFFKVLRGVTHCPSILSELQLVASEHPRTLRSRGVFNPINARTKILMDSPLARAIRLLNEISAEIDIFHISYGELESFLISHKFVNFLI